MMMWEGERRGAVRGKRGAETSLRDGSVEAEENWRGNPIEKRIEPE